MGSRILAYRVCHDAPDHLALEVRYVYDGSRPRRAFLGAITTVNGRSLGYWAYRPDPVFEGTHWARVLVGLNEDAPVVHQTTEIRFSMYEGGGAAFEEVSIPYYKRWRWHPSAGHPPVCHREWGAGCGGPIPTGPPPERRPCASGRWQVRRPG